MDVVGARALVTSTAVVLAMVTVVGLATMPSSAGGGATAECAEVFDLDGPRLYLPASETATAEGTTSLDRAADVRLVVRFQDDQSPQAAVNDSVYLDDHGGWRATIDLSAIEEGREFIAALKRAGEVVEAVPGEIGQATATVSVENQTISPTDAEITVRQVYIGLGGFVAIHDEEPRGPIIGASDYIAPGTHENVTIELDETSTDSMTVVAMRHYDGDCDRLFTFMITPDDGPYVEDTTPLQPVTDTASIQFSTPTSSPTPTATPSPTPTPTIPATSTPSPTGTSTSTPGFGLGTALVALTGTVLLWRRR